MRKKKARDSLRALPANYAGLLSAFLPATAKTCGDGLPRLNPGACMIPRLVVWLQLPRCQDCKTL